ncbi:MAG: hypothetical protein FWD73_15305 [Polyangiaceae bacterium]|nr:hypothetical protein [Polyangiaceae bacterium]
MWAYHLPFAARIAGIVDSSTYSFSAENQHRFEGFPLLVEAIQGTFWRVTGRPECANFVALLSLASLIIALRFWFKVPLHLSLLALLAIPLVQTHTTAAYVDLPANVCVTLLVLVTYRSLVRCHGRAPSVRTLAVAAALAAMAVNMKFQLLPLTAATACVLVVLSLRADENRRARLLVIALALPIVFATPLKNALAYGNPVWPIELRVPGLRVPFAEAAYASSPRWLEHASRPVRFVCSVLEIGVRPIASKQRWSIDQFAPIGDPAYRMGGFFGAYVVGNALALALACVRIRIRASRAAAWLFAGVTAAVSLMPQSHELRYYLVWMLLLVSLNLVFWSRVRPLTTGMFATCALGVVVWSTNAVYIYPNGDTFATFLAEHVDQARVRRFPPGARICMTREPWTFLWAGPFHGRSDYVVQQEAEASDCEGAVRLGELPPTK